MMRSGPPLVCAASFFAAMLWFRPSNALGQTPPVPKRILAVHWEDKTDAAEEFDRSLQQALRSSGPGPVDYYSEFLDATRFPGEDQSEALATFLRRKYASRKMDVVVTDTPPPLDFLFKYRSDLFADIPIVFATTQRPSEAHLAAGAGATGITYSGYRETLELALRLHPGSEHVFIVSNSLPTGPSWERVVRDDLEGFQSPADITYLTDLPLEELTTRLRTLPRHSIVLYVWQRGVNRQGVALDTHDLLSFIAPSVPAPIYGLSFANVGLGIVGGYVWTRETRAAKLAEITLKVANGTPPADIPVENSPLVPMFDWRQLQRWGIAEDDLPPNSIIHFKTITMWEQYRWRILAVMLVVILQALLIGALLLERNRSRRAASDVIRAQRILQESEARFRNMADTAPVLIWVSGPDGLCTFFNKGWLNFTGRGMEQELGDKWTECVHPDDLDGCAAAMHSASFGVRMSFRTEFRLRRADGEYRSMLSTGVPRFEQEGGFAGYIGSCLDISDLKLAQERALAGQKLESIGLLATGIAHDFNNLLGGILTSAELALMEQAEDTDFREELERIKAAAIGGAQIVRELLVFGGKETHVFEPVDCALLIHEMSQVLKVSISKFAILKTEIAENLAPVSGDPAQIRQIIMNLVINASQAIGERKGEIQITAKMVTLSPNSPLRLPQGDYLQLAVADTGCGISEEVRAKIFDPFFTTKTTGRGLGLAVVQGMVHAHRGAIKVMSIPGSGTVFQILLPTVSKDQKRIPSRAGMPEAANEEPFSTAVVLIIEDEETLRSSVSKMLRMKGFAVIEAEDGNTGLDLFVARQSQVDAVLLDMTLPGRTGRAVLEEVQRIDPGAKVIITSAYGREHVQNSLQGLRPWGYIQKPYHVADLVKLLQDASDADGSHKRSVPFDSIIRAPSQVPDPSDGPRRLC
jgi:PAS domain S-box-containing protein